MRIGLHDADRTSFPNLALMKLSAWHKDRGDEVVWWNPMEACDRVYSSKVFTNTPDDPYLPDDAIRGGTGYGMDAVLDDNIEHILPDYDLYGIDYAVGFLTRGCFRRCPWCIVPEKEGKLHAHASYTEFMHPDSLDFVFIDNNPLGCSHGLDQIAQLAGTNARIDFNQALDARLIAKDEGIAELLAACRWLRPVRLACDTMGQMRSVEVAVGLLRKHDCTPKNYQCYVLVEDVESAYHRVEFLRGLGVDPFAMPFIDFKANKPPTQEQRQFARWVNHKAVWKSVKWSEYKGAHRGGAMEGQRGLFA